MPQCYIIHMLLGLFEYETVAVTLSTVLLLERLLGLRMSAEPQEGYLLFSQLGT